MLNARAPFSFPSCKGSKPDIMEMHVIICPIACSEMCVLAQDHWIICRLLIVAYLLSLTTCTEAFPVIY